MGLSLAVLAPAATLAAGGVEVWPRFAAKVAGHMSAPLSNNMGLTWMSALSVLYVVGVTARAAVKEEG